MNKKINTAILAVSCVVMSVGSAFAAEIRCKPVSIQGIGMNGSDIVLTLRNESGGTCAGDANWINNQDRQFFINNDVSPDQVYATVLTAFSMEKKLSIKGASPSTVGGLLVTVGILK